jgi:hypothetical protein
VRITIATGRLFPGTREAARVLGVDGHVAVMNGSEHVHARTGAIGHRRGMSKEARAASREVLQPCGLPTFLFASGGIHHDLRAPHVLPYVRVFSEVLETHEDVFQAPKWERDDDILSVCAAGPRARIAEAADALRLRLPSGFGVVTYPGPGDDRFLEIRHQGEDKGTALARLAAERGVTAKETVAVGDWMNDLPMLRAAGRSYAMRGADSETVEAADAVLPADRGCGGAVEAVARIVWGL